MTGDDIPFVQALVGTLLGQAVPDLRSAERTAAAEFAAERLSQAPAVTRLGMRAIGRALDGQVRVAERRPFAALAPQDRERWVGRWTRRPLPGLTDYLDALRGLALTFLYEQRAA
jgi:hypothetical protein